MHVIGFSLAVIDRIMYALSYKISHLQIDTGICLVYIGIHSLLQHGIQFVGVNSTPIYMAYLYGKCLLVINGILYL